MASILQGELAEDVAAALDAAGVPYTVTVTRPEQGDLIDPAQPWLGYQTVDVDHTGQGWVDQYSDFDLASTLIQAGDRRVFILIATLDIEPAATNTLTLDGQTFTIQSVKRDPAGTLWDIQARA